jgi:hypothetical protein
VAKTPYASTIARTYLEGALEVRQSEWTIESEDDGWLSTSSPSLEAILEGHLKAATKRPSRSALSSRYDRPARAASRTTVKSANACFMLSDDERWSIDAQSDTANAEARPYSAGSMPSATAIATSCCGSVMPS